MTTYMRRKPEIIEAVLWRGFAADLAALPNFNDLVASIINIDGTGLMILDINGHEISVDKDKDYVVFKDGDFDVIDNKTFEKEYEAAPIPAATFERK